MSENKSFYITTTLPYVNADPHIGFAAELIRADVIARYKRYQDFEVFFNTGTDEHGQKIWQNAQEAGKNVKDYVDEYAEKFKELIVLTNINPDIRFIRTTDKHHISAAQEFWKRCEKTGDIYKKLYTIKYCVGCELEKTDSELVDGKCPIHPNKELEVREEENYFFKFSKYEKPLLDFYNSNPEFVVPDFRFNEIITFVKRGLQDFSISRLKSKMSWGVPVPGDEDHVMYVWFDALINYISTLGWPENEEQFRQFWIEGTPVQYAGKDNLRQQSAMWQAMLMSAKLPLTKHVVINGFINSNGQKMSKSLGNVVNPKKIVEKYGAEALRYLVCREFSNFEDSDFTWEKMAEAYNANLSNGVGNLVARIMKLSEDHLAETPKEMNKVPISYNQALEKFEIKNAIDQVFKKIAELDEEITRTEPFKVIKIDVERGKELIRGMVKNLHTISYMIMPFMPRTGQQIHIAITENKKPKNLFPRINA